MASNTIQLKKSLQKPVGLSGVKISFLLGVLCAFCIFLPLILADGGMMLYDRDFNYQQIPFNMHMNQFFKNGVGTWDWGTDLGTSAIASYSFYNLGSPFFWVMCLFPSRFVPYLMAPMLILKFGCIAAAACLYLQRYAKTKEMAVICSLVYAFCGFNVYNVFFNHMLEPVIFFPLLLWALDGFMLEKKRGWFALFVGLALIDNYFFFVGNVVFLLLYFFVKLAYKEYTIKPKEFGLLAFEAVLGVGIGLVLALPSLYYMMGNPRTTEFANGFGLIGYVDVQQYFAIFSSLLLPPDPPGLANLFTQGHISWTSLSAYLPIVTISGVVAYWRGGKQKSIKMLLGICFLCAMVPVFNAAFYAFNSAYYARWFYMPLLVMCLATLHALEDAEIDIARGAKVAFGLTLAYVVSGFLPTKVNDVMQIGMALSQGKFWLTFITAALGAGIFYVLATRFKGKVNFAPLLLCAVMCFSVFYSTIHMSLTKYSQGESYDIFRERTVNASAEIQLPDDGFYRIDTYGTFQNLGLWMEQSSIQTFHSVVSPSIVQFYEFVGHGRNVQSNPNASHFGVRGLLGVKYTLVPLARINVPFTEASVTPEEKVLYAEIGAVPYTDMLTPPPAEALRLGWAPNVDTEDRIGVDSPGAQGWQCTGLQGGYAIFENQNFVPLGFTYSQYASMSRLAEVDVLHREMLLMRGIGLTNEQLEQYGHLFEGDVVQQEGDAYTYGPVDYPTYAQDCTDRRESAAYRFETSNAGFTCGINMPKENLVFFSVPYSEGFTATVNGVAAEVLRVSGGMMAVYAPAGDNTIVFTYKTPGFRAGAAITLCSLAVLAAYVYLGKRLQAKKGPR